MAKKQKRKARNTTPSVDVYDVELIAMSRVLDALKGLDAEVQQSAIDWAVRKFKLKNPFTSQREEESDLDRDFSQPGKRVQIDESAPEPERETKPSAKQQDGEIEGVNAVAQKWIKRSGFSENQLSKLFTLGVDDIDVVAKKIPGGKKIERLKNVLLLQGVAAFLGSGVARVDWPKLKEAAKHYNADAGGNYASYMKKLAAEATGSVQTGYALTSRGLNDAKELIVQMTTPQATAKN